MPFVAAVAVGEVKSEKPPPCAPGGRTIGVSNAAAADVSKAPAAPLVAALGCATPDGTPDGAGDAGAVNAGGGVSSRSGDVGLVSRCGEYRLEAGTWAWLVVVGCEMSSIVDRRSSIPRLTEV